MRTFKDGERVTLLAKTCGEVLSLDSMIYTSYIGKKKPPVSGTVMGFSHDHHKFGDFYTVQIDDYDGRWHRFRQFCFKEDDLRSEGEVVWGIDEDLFTI